MYLSEFVKLVEVKDISGVIAFCVFAVLSFVQLSPLKINPWDVILSWVGDRIFKDTNVKIDGIRADLDEHIMAEMRRDILNHARQCRLGMEHSKEQWNHVLTQAKRYERYVEEKQLANGVIEVDTEYIRELYKELSREGRIK